MVNDQMVNLIVDKLNWPDTFPERPEVTVDVRNSRDSLFLDWHVRGEQLRAVTTADQGPVWEDSCVEFFCQVPGERHYMNFETNCIGAMVASRRLGRAEDVQPLSPAEMAQIERRCRFRRVGESEMTNARRESIEEQDGLFEWDVALRIPLSLIFRDRQPAFPQPLRVNFYKCADKTRRPHYLSWAPIPLPKPDFHCPQFFREIQLV